MFIHYFNSIIDSFQKNWYPVSYVEIFGYMSMTEDKNTQNGKEHEQSVTDQSVHEETSPANVGENGRHSWDKNPPDVGSEPLRKGYS